VRILGGIFGAAVGVVLSASAADAGLVTYQVDFTASGLSNYTDPGRSLPPFDPVTGSFTLTFDPANNYDDEANGITLNALNIGLPAQFLFTYDPTLFGGLLEIGSDPNGVNTLIGGTNDFYVEIYDFLSTPTADYLAYTQATTEDGYDTSDVSATVTTLSTTPIPPSLLLFTSALGSLGFAGWRRKQANSAA